jgi:uncharacterized membrane protein
MKFLRTTLTGGLFVLFPLLLFYMAIKEIFGAVLVLVEPIADLFPESYFNDVHLPGVLAAILLALAAFIFGLLARAAFVRRLGLAIEHNVLEKFPMYTMLRSVSNAFLDADSSSFLPAILSQNDGSGDPCYIVEEFGDDVATVLLPWSPTSFAGSIKIVPRRSLRKLDCSLDEYSRSISLMGVGVANCVIRRPESDESGL